MGKTITTKWRVATGYPWVRLVTPVLALTAGMLFSTGPAYAQPLYNNLTTPAIDGRNNAPAYLNVGGTAPFQFVVESTRPGNGNTIDTLVTQMLSDELKLAGNNLADVVVNSLAVSITNANIGLDMVVRPHIRIYDDNHPTPAPPYPSPINNDSPGTLLYSLDLGDFTIPGATADPGRTIAGSAILNVDSTQFGALNLPMTTAKYWFGIFFDVDQADGVDLNTQVERLRQVGLGLYNPPTIGSSADVHHETDRYATGDANGNGIIDAGEVGFPNYQKNYFSSTFANGDPNGTYISVGNAGGQGGFGFKDPNGNFLLSNFGWVVNGFVVPEPSAAAFALLGIPAFGLIIRRRKP